MPKSILSQGFGGRNPPARLLLEGGEVSRGGSKGSRVSHDGNSARRRQEFCDDIVGLVDDNAAEHIAQTVNALRGKVTIVFIAHRVPKGLTVGMHVDLARGTLAMP